MRVYLGVVTNVIDEEKFIIEATVKGLFEAITAYPIDLLDKPEIKDTILIYCIDSELMGQSLLYQKLRLSEVTRLSLGTQEISLDKDSITIKTETNQVRLTNEGDIEINSTNTIFIKSDQDINLEAPSVNIKSGSISSNFSEPFICPHTGKVHINHQIG